MMSTRRDLQFIVESESQFQQYATISKRLPILVLTAPSVGNFGDLTGTGLLRGMAVANTNRSLAGEWSQRLKF